jgi:hypothetical protein
MLWQWSAVALSVLVAVAYLARQTWRTWAGRKSGCGECSCAAKKETSPRGSSVPLIPTSELTSRLRRR